MDTTKIKINFIYFYEFEIIILDVIFPVYQVLVTSHKEV